MQTKALRLLLVLLAMAVLFAGCQQQAAEKKEEPANEVGQTEQAEEKPELSGEVLVDGSSTVYPIAEGVAEEFQAENPNVKVTIGVSGTGGGMKKFVAGEIDVCNASRAIKDEEKAEAKKNGIKYAEFKVAFDGIAVVVNKENNWIDSITTAQLKEIWKPDSKIKTWSDINKNYPKQKIVLFGPDADSGTFEYFTEEIVGEKKKSRSDYTQSADDNVLVEGVAGEKYALGYFGFAYYYENRDKVKVLKVDGVEPNHDTIKSGAYKPLSRPLFIYVNIESLKKPQVYEFVKFFLANAGRIAEEVGYVSLDQEEYDSQLKNLETMK